jgi:hypothetical protein
MPVKPSFRIFNILTSNFLDHRAVLNRMRYVKDARVGFNGPNKDRHFDLDGGDHSSLKKESISS